MRHRILVEILNKFYLVWSWILTKEKQFVRGSGNDLLVHKKFFKKKIEAQKTLIEK